MGPFTPTITPPAAQRVKQETYTESQEKARRKFNFAWQLFFFFVFKVVPFTKGIFPCLAAPRSHLKILTLPM